MPESVLKLRPWAQIPEISVSFFTRCTFFTRPDRKGRGRGAKLTWRHSAAFRKLERLSCDTCTSPLYMNSSNADMLLDDVPSRMTRMLGHTGAVSNRSWKCLLHAAKMSLWALNVTPATERERKMVGGM